MATVQLVKLALKRDPAVPVGQAAALYLDCACGTRVPIAPMVTFTDHPIYQDWYTCEGCGACYTAGGWLVRSEIPKK